MIDPALPPGWRALARFTADPAPPAWREALAERLGERPRRIGLWAELALYGARGCLDAAGEATLAAGACLRVASTSGARSATHAAAAQAHAGVLMPFGFMQSQPSQMLAALGQHLGWQGDAAFFAVRDTGLLLRMACREAGPAGLLFGVVEDEQGDVLRTAWLRLVPG